MAASIKSLVKMHEGFSTEHLTQARDHLLEAAKEHKDAGVIAALVTNARRIDRVIIWRAEQCHH